MASMAPLPTDALSQDIYLRWATRSDIPAITKILYDFFLDFEFHEHCCPRRKQSPGEYYLWVSQRIRKFFVNPGMKFMVAERIAVKVSGEEREVVGFSAWVAQGEENPVRREWTRQDESWVRMLERQLAHLEGLHHKYLVNTVFDYDAFAQLWNALEATHSHIEKYKNQMHLQFLFVAPQWRKGYGVGRRLLQFGLDIADRTGLPIVIESSLGGYPFYLRMGCELLTTIRVDIVPEKAYDMPVVVYEPKSKGDRSIES